MQVVALASQTGGSGKTMLAAHLAVQADLAGAGPVVLIDIDPRGTLAGWWKLRNADMPALAHTTVERLEADLEMLRVQGFLLAIIDTPAAISAAVSRSVALAELVLVPVRPNGEELRAPAGTIELCQRAGKPALFVVNGAARGEELPPEMTLQLARHGPVAPYPIPHDGGIVEAMLLGQGIAEAGNEGGGAAPAMRALWTYVASRLERKFRRTVFAVPRPAAAGFGRRGL